MHNSIIRAIQILQRLSICFGALVLLTATTQAETRLIELIDFVETNNRSWRSYDIMIEEELVSDQESLYESTLKSRIKVDWNRKRAICIARLQKSSVMSDGAQVDSKLIVKMVNGKTYTDWYGNRKSTIKCSSFLDAIAECQFPQIERTGLETPPYYPIPAVKGAQFATFWRIIRAEFKDLATAHRLATRTDVVVTRRVLNTQFAMAMKWSFDNDTLMPIAHSRTNVLREGQPDESRYEAERAVFDWKEYEGFWLPVKVEVKGLSKSGNNEFKTVKFRWLSVNEAIEFPDEMRAGSSEYWQEQLKIGPEKPIAQPIEKEAE